MKIIPSKKSFIIVFILSVLVSIIVTLRQPKRYTLIYQHIYE